jgi:hypothetical protein
MYRVPKLFLLAAGFQILPKELKDPGKGISYKDDLNDRHAHASGKSRHALFHSEKQACDVEPDQRGRELTLTRIPTQSNPNCRLWTLSGPSFISFRWRGRRLV